MTEIINYGTSPDDKTTAEAVNFLVRWALKQMPPLSVIAACDRALWWAYQRLPDDAEEDASD